MHSSQACWSASIAATGLTSFSLLILKAFLRDMTIYDMCCRLGGMHLLNLLSCLCLCLDLLTSETLAQERAQIQVPKATCSAEFAAETPVLRLDDNLGDVSLQQLQLAHRNLAVKQKRKSKEGRLYLTRLPNACEFKVQTCLDCRHDNSLELYL